MESSENKYQSIRILIELLAVALAFLPWFSEPMGISWPWNLFLLAPSFTLLFVSFVLEQKDQE